MTESKVDVFDAQSVSKKFVVGGKQIVVSPVSFKMVRKLATEIEKAFNRTSNLDKGSGVGIEAIMNAILDEGNSLISSAFPGAENSFLTKEFLEDNLDIPTGMAILRAIIEVNRIDAILPPLKGIVDKLKG